MARPRNNSKLVQKYKNEPKVGVLGSTIYKKSIGDFYTFTFNGFPVHIKFDGTTQYYPETIAKVLQRKLQAISEAETPKNEKVELGKY